MYRIKNWFQDISLRTRLLFSFILLSMIPLILLALISYRLSYEMISKNTTANAEMIIDRVRDELDSLISEALQVADSIAGNGIIQEALQGNFNPEDQQYILNTKAGEELLKIFEYREDLFGIAVIGENGQSLISTDYATRKEDFRSRYWYREVLQASRPPIYYPPHLGSFVFNQEESSFFTLAIPVEDKYSSARIGVVTIDIEEGILKKILHLRLDERGYLFIQYGRSGFTSSNDESPDSEYLVRLANKKEIEAEHLSKNKEVVLIRDLILDDMQLASVISLVELSRDSRKIGLVLSLLILVSIAFSLLAASLLSLSIARPVQQIRTLMMEVEEGDLTVRMPQMGANEIGDLGRSFNRMVLRIKNLMHNVQEDQIQLRKAELRTLQDQINPHFLYNTLDSINWLTKEGRNDDVIAMVTGLTNLFRISISRGSDIITFREEISHMKSYLIIQKIRYEKQFLYDIDIDEDAMNCLTIKLILQPLVENALYHGIKEKKGRGHISIRGRKLKNHILVEIEDNGLGIEEERLREVRKALNRPASQKNKTLYGIKNVNDRLKIYYGESYGLSLHSVAGEGTTVTLRIPTEVKKSD